MIDGATNSTTSFDARLDSGLIAVDSATNKIYVANTFSGVDVIDGLTNTITATLAITAAPGPAPIVVNPVTNKIYVACGGTTPTVTVIDGATNTTTAVAASNPSLLAVNPPKFSKRSRYSSSLRSIGPFGLPGILPNLLSNFESLAVL